MKKQVFGAGLICGERRKQLFERHHGQDYDTFASIRQVLYGAPEMNHV
jgi:hypothetical protein